MNDYPKSVLSIHAHPCDCESFNSGTLKLLKDRGYRITIATMTGGGLGSFQLSQCKAILTRKKEAKHSAAVLEADYFCFDQEDCFLFDNEKIRIDVASLIREVNPGIIFTHLPFDYHADHRVTGKIVEMACLISALPNFQTKEPPLDTAPLLYYTAPRQLIDILGNPLPNPHFYIDVSSAMNQKMEMFSHHESQIELYKEVLPERNFFDLMKEQNAQTGAHCQAPYAEAYWQHHGRNFNTDALVQTELHDFLKQQP